MFPKKLRGMDKLTGYEEYERRIHHNLSNMKRNLHIEVLLEELLGEIWKMDDGNFQWKPELSIERDGEWVYNPDIKQAIQVQKDILWRKLSGHDQRKMITYHQK